MSSAQQKLFGEAVNDAVKLLRQRLGPLNLKQIAAWQQMSPAQRLDVAFQAYQFALDAVRLTERRNHPELSAEELAWRMVRRIHGRQFRKRSDHGAC